MSYQDPNQQPNPEEYNRGYQPSQPSQPAQPYGDQQPQQSTPYYQPSNPQGGYYQPSNPQQPDPQGGYQQPGGSQYQQPPNYGQQQWNAGQSTQTTWGLSPNIESALCYILFWVSGLVILFTEKQNRQVRFHAMQSVILFGGLNILLIVLGVLPFIGWILSPFVWFVWFVAWIGMMIIAFTGNSLRIPVVSDYADRYVDRIKAQ